GPRRARNRDARVAEPVPATRSRRSCYRRSVSHAGRPGVDHDCDGGAAVPPVRAEHRPVLCCPPPPAPSGGGGGGGAGVRRMRPWFPRPGALLLAFASVPAVRVPARAAAQSSSRSQPIAARYRAAADSLIDAALRDSTAYSRLEQLVDSF